ncbi:hypothetical protein SMUE_00270 [Enterococcus cecorum]
MTDFKEKRSLNEPIIGWAIIELKKEPETTSEVSLAEYPLSIKYTAIKQEKIANEK